VVLKEGVEVRMRNRTVVAVCVIIACAGMLYGQQSDTTRMMNAGFQNGGMDTSLVRRPHKRNPNISRTTNTDAPPRSSETVPPTPLNENAPRQADAIVPVQSNVSLKDTVASESPVVTKNDTATIAESEIPQRAKDTTSLNFKDTDLRDVFRALSYQHNLNLFVDNAINKRITVSLSNVRVYDAIKFICEQQNLIFKLDGGIFKVMPPPPLPKPLPPPPKEPWVYYENNLLSVKLKNDELEAVVQKIQDKAKKNILLLNGTSGNISGTLNDIDFDLGFTQLMNNNGFAVQKKNGIYTISRLDYYVGSQTGQQGAQKAGPYWISVHDSLVTIDVTNAPLDRVLSDIGRQLNTDVIFYNQVTGSVTARATNIPLERALGLLLRNTTFSYRQSEGMYFIGDKANKTMTATKLIRLKYLRADKTLEMMPQAISSQATMKAIKESNGIVIVASNDVITQAAEFIQEVDRPVAQVLIEAIVVDYDRTKALSLGVNAGFAGSKDSTLNTSRTDAIIPGVNMTVDGSQIKQSLMGVANIGKLPDNFYVQLKAMEQKGVANVKSRPVLATLSGSPASLSIGTTQYYLLTTTTNYPSANSNYSSNSQAFSQIDADVKLEITPYVGSDGQITVEIKPDFKTPVGTLSSSTPPTINKRSMSSTIIVREGETIALGGMIQDQESESRTQVPLLGSIPLLGYLFSSTSKSHEKSELMIYVTPHISYGEAFHTFVPSIEEP
jgi:type IV pilus assembly protein PilQ